MKLHTVFARFYKSFNFDHLRKVHPDAIAKPWETFDDVWYPYVEVPIDECVTAIVGANESGKSHLLDAVEKAITGRGFEQRDLCRYSPYFSVEKGKTCWPHVGIAWSDLDETETNALKSALGLETTGAIDRFVMFREGPDKLTVWVPNTTDDNFVAHTFLDDKAREFGSDFLPSPFRIKPDVALPNSVPLAWLVNPGSATAPLMSRKSRTNLTYAGAALLSHWRSDPAQLAQAAPQMISVANDFFVKSQPATDTPEQKAAFELARNLLIHLANIEPVRLADLSEAIANGDDGHANALMSRINDQLAKKINFPKWWIQDRDFSLRVTLRELDLVFTVRDRTGTEYTFGERSSGLKYFLSYLIQSQVHERQTAHSEILLMDEPDTYLSAEAQQDLLKIFGAFAQPDDEIRPVQVIYVTHSPFLLDKNHAERIRVLQKGRGHDGTRVIRNASKNHYEPLRSAFGAFVGETAFVGACNLLVEGTSDQILLAGLARVIRKRSKLEGDSLDLNRLVIVPCGSASQMPYTLYLIRGRDAEKPPVIVLLDSDDGGQEAAKFLRGKDRRIRRLIDPDLVLLLGDLKLFGDDTPTKVSLEDLVPEQLALAAANVCLEEIARFREGAPMVLSHEDVSAVRPTSSGVFEALNQAAQLKGAHFEKIAFSRAVVEIVERRASHPALNAEVENFMQRMRVLFQSINRARRKAEREALQERIGAMVERQQSLFVRDHPQTASKEAALALLENIEDILDESNESDEVRTTLSRLRKDFELDDSAGELVQQFDSFKLRLSGLKDAFLVARLEPENGLGATMRASVTS